MFTNEITSLVVSNVITAVVWIAIASMVPEPSRQRSQAIIVAMAGGIYLLGPLSLVDVGLSLAIVACAYLGLTRYWGIGLAWLLHTGLDLIHHAFGLPMIPSAPLSSLGCAILDPILAIWFFLGAPSVWRKMNLAK